MPKPERCPHCGAKESLVSVGPGVERVEEEARELFPGGAARGVLVRHGGRAPEAARALIAAMTAGEIDILVATQGAAKGHNFPNLTLVGVVDADLGLRGGDLRAAERTFQLLAQVAGRAGRRAQAGPRAAADLGAGASGDAGPGRAGPRRLRRRSRWPSARPPACRRSAGWRR